MVVKTTGGTVGEVLNANGIEYDENDMISYPPGMYVQPGDEIVYQEVVVEQSVEQEPIEHETEYRGSSLLPRGRTRVIQVGSDGERELTYNKTIVDGEVDHLPEAAFSMVGDIDEAIEKAKEMERNGI